MLKDYLDPAAVITPAGAVDERYSYDAFGPYRLLTPCSVLGDRVPALGTFSSMRSSWIWSLDSTIMGIGRIIHNSAGG